jgi:Protein of unknown function (DUF4233)
MRGLSWCGETRVDQSSHGAEPAAGHAGGGRSGLRNPAAAIRAIGAGALAAEGLVLLLAIVPMAVLGVGWPGITVIVALALVSFVLAGLVRHAWVWYVAIALPVVLLVSGFAVHASLVVLGVLFGLLWAYVLYVRRSVLR